MKPSNSHAWPTRFVASSTLAVIALVWTTDGQEPQEKPRNGAFTGRQVTFKQQVQPLLKKYCLRCHNVDEMKSGVRVDLLNGKLEDRQLRLWKGILEQVSEEAMPPEDETQPTPKERHDLVTWIQQTLVAARSQETARNGSVRRLTVAQYRNTLRDLLGLEEDLADVLPPDSMSKDGFVNNGPNMLLSPLLVESYFDIAEKAIDLCIVDEQSKPVIQTFRMDLGATVNPRPCPDNLILGANSLLLKNADFQVTELQPDKPFNYEPFVMKTSYEFIEGYQGNATVRGRRQFNSIYHAVFACMRGTRGYPKGRAYETVPEGLLLRPAIPSSELFGRSSTYGPMANFKVSLRELPEHGNFRVTVKAARYNDGLLLNRDERVQDDDRAVVAAPNASSEATVMISEAGVYQVDVAIAPIEKKAAEKRKGPATLSLQLGNRHFSGVLYSHKRANPNVKPAEQVAAFLLVRLPAGPLKLAASKGNDWRLRRIAFSPVDGELAARFQAFEQRSPQLSVQVGLRRDCGSTLTRVGEPLPIRSTDFEEYTFAGAINNFPSPDVEKNNVNYLAGVREIGVRSDYTDGRDMPRLMIRSLQFEGPYYNSWPPATHRNIFIDSPQRNDPEAYAGQVIRSFARRAFRRPISDTEQASLFAVWKDSFAQTGDFQQSIKDALLVVLTSPQFLFLVENSSGPEAEDLDAYELASKLSYFLWNTAPDKDLLELAAANELHESLDAQLRRMILDPRFERFADQFTSQWLSLDKFDVVEVDQNRYPKLTRDTRTELRKEPIYFLRHLIENNLPIKNLLQSDFILANDVVASYYDLGERTESGFRFVPVTHDRADLGGVLTQASILAGLSDGRESNPVKRGAWLARKIIAEPPDDPPPNVPQLQEEDGTKLTLRQKLERHRNQEGCAKCHAGIDPWGVPFEEFDAGGLLKQGQKVDARSTLPDKTEVSDLNGLKNYLTRKRIDRVAFSFLKHLATYAIGRSLTYNELVLLEEEGVKLKANDYRIEDLFRFVVNSEMFLKK